MSERVSGGDYDSFFLGDYGSGEAWHCPFFSFATSYNTG